MVVQDVEENRAAYNIACDWDAGRVEIADATQIPCVCRRQGGTRNGRKTYVVHLGSPFGRTEDTINIHIKYVRVCF